MRIAIIWFSLFLCLTPLQKTFADPQIINLDQVVVNEVLNNYIEVFRTADYTSPEEIMNRIQKGTNKPISEKSSAGFSEDYFWIYFKATSLLGQEGIIDIDNPHIDHIELFKSNDLQNWTSIGKAGDKIPFHERPIINRKFVFDLGIEAGQESHYLLMIDKRNASVSFPIKIWNGKSFFEKEYNSNIYLGLYFGLLLFIGVFSLFTGIGINDKLFLSYGTYVLLVTLYIFTQLGFSFQFIYPTSTVLNNYARVVLVVALTISSIDFFRRFLNVREYFIRIYQGLTATIYFLISILLAWIVYKLISDDYSQSTILLLQCIYATIFLFFITIIYVVIRTWNIQLTTARLFTAAFSMMMLGSGSYILIEMGILPESDFPINPVMAGSILEIIIFSGSMVQRVISINNSKRLLDQRIAQQRKELLKAFVNGGEEERARISADLHDNIGSNISLLKKKLISNGSSKEELADEFDQLLEEVRAISSRLTPHHLELTGLENSVRKLCRDYATSLNIDIDCNMYSLQKVSDEVSLTIYRVSQEALQNIARHSQATGVDFQLVGYKNEIILTIDDNGVGFDQNKQKYGNGIQNMQSRVESLGGSIQIDSFPGKGTNIVVTLPTPWTEAAVMN